MYNICYQPSTTEVSSLVDARHPECEIHWKVTLCLEQDIQLGQGLLREFPIPQVLRKTLYFPLTRQEQVDHACLILCAYGLVMLQQLPSEPANFEGGWQYVVRSLSGW